MTFGDDQFGELLLGGDADNERLTFIEALLAHLIDYGVPVFYTKNPAGPEDLPCIVVELVDVQRTNSFSGRASNVPYTVTITVWSHHPGTTSDLTNDIRDDIDGLTGLMGGRLVAYSSWQGVDEDIRSPGDGTENWIYGLHTTYEICAERD